MDPVTTAFNVAFLLINGADDLGNLIARLQDRQRTLEQAEADADAASARLLNPAAQVGDES